MDTGQTPAMIAASTRAAYGPGRHLRVRSSGIVHDVMLTGWLAAELLPGPACMVGVAGWDPSAAHPDSGPVTCKRCLRLNDEAPPGVLAEQGSGAVIKLGVGTSSVADR
ncbi:hypothetical protein [Nonomuraea typhae]|uniref:Uncharacterized protein n=1 Tax=Nonomuraea typhae TaxID=2603600 RepID=A0ABW7Z8E1_9ACTN